MSNTEAAPQEQTEATVRAPGLLETVRQAGTYLLERVCDFSNAVTPDVVGQNGHLEGRSYRDPQPAFLDRRG